MGNRYPPQYLEFLDRFNEGEYYTCHDLLEELWMEERHNKFLQGLLQLAVALYHAELGNLRGARLMLSSAKGYLEPYRPRFWSLDIDGVVAYIDRCLAALPPQDRIPWEEARHLSLPRLHLQLEEEDR
ncbi:MAG: DUF309 domain-containing protein [Calditerricola sp.]|nr:DUF309 domain-containing protein [Calditerricola sp.]